MTLETAEPATANVDAALKRLSRGLVADSDEDIYRAHRDLYRIGTAAVPAIEASISQASWQKIRHAEEVRYLTGMLNVLRDIDEARSTIVIDRILAEDCAPIVRSILNSIRRDTRDNYRIYTLQNIDIYEAKSIGLDHRVREHLSRWLEPVPEKDLDGIERIYVVEFDEDFDWAGQYMPVLRTISLSWYADFSGRNLVSRMSRFHTKFVFYHEIGHHAHRHTFGQDSDREREADRYAMRLIRTQHRFYVRFLRIFRALRIDRIFCRHW